MSLRINILKDKTNRIAASIPLTSSNMSVVLSSLPTYNKFLYSPATNASDDCCCIFNLFFSEMKVKSMLDFTHLYGLINILNRMGGKTDVAAISSRGQLELADVLPMLEIGQILDFIEVKS